jgi:hypothetical protein
MSCLEESYQEWQSVGVAMGSIESDCLPQTAWSLLRTKGCWSQKLQFDAPHISISAWKMEGDTVIEIGFILEWAWYLNIVAWVCALILLILKVTIQKVRIFFEWKCWLQSIYMLWGFHSNFAIASNIGFPLGFDIKILEVCWIKLIRWLQTILISSSPVAVRPQLRLRFPLN